MIFFVNWCFCEVIVFLDFNLSNVLGYFVYLGCVRVELFGDFFVFIFVYYDYEYVLLIICKNVCLILGIVCKRLWYKCGIVI